MQSQSSIWIFLLYSPCLQCNQKMKTSYPATAVIYYCAFNWAEDNYLQQQKILTKLVFPLWSPPAYVPWQNNSSFLSTVSIFTYLLIHTLYTKWTADHLLCYSLLCHLSGNYYPIQKCTWIKYLVSIAGYNQQESMLFFVLLSSRE